MALRLHHEDRLRAAVVAARRGEILVATDEFLSGRLGETWRRNPDLAARLPAVVRAPFDRLIDTAKLETPVPVAESESGDDARPPLVDPLLADPHHRLDTFFEALFARERDARDKVRILYFGTSEIGHDRVTSQLRRHLQERFGDGGKGWVLIDRTWAILDHRDVIWTHEEPNWTSYSIRTGVLEHGHYGLGGVLVASTGPAWAEYGTTVPGRANAEGYYEFPSGTAWSRVEVHYQGHRRGGTLSVAVDDQEPTRIDTDRPRLTDEVYEIDLEDGPHRLRLEAEPRVHGYGVVLERGQGLVLDALMVIGAWGDSMLNYDAEHLAAQVDRRDPALAIFQLGAKESLRHPELSPQQTREFVAGYQRSVELVMAGREETACLIISPKDQAYEIGGRILTRPAVPRLVAGAEEVARSSGCAFYNLYEAMGGEGTARRWALQTPRLVSSDLGHLEAEGSIRIGDILSDLLLGEYEVFRQWRHGDAVRDLFVADGGGPMTEAEELALAIIAEDEIEMPKPCTHAGKSVIDCRDPLEWIRTNERGHPLWAEHIRGRGGGYVGVGGDQSYDFIAEAKSQWAWIVNDDFALTALHEILLAVVRLAETPEEFTRAFTGERAEATRDTIRSTLASSRFSAPEQSAIAGVFDDIRRELERYARRLRRERPIFPEWGWLHVPERYAFIRSLVVSGRIRTVRASLTGAAGLVAVANSAAALGAPVRVVYLSNEESTLGRLPPRLRTNLGALPFDADTLVLRTLPDAGWNRDRDFSRWHYVIHEGLHLQEKLADPSFRGPEQMMREATPVDECVSWIGAHGKATAANDGAGPEVAPVFGQPDLRHR
jgi:hypothetical protein